MLCDVITAKLLNEYRLEVVFEGNKRGVIDFSEYLSKGGVFEKFKEVYLEPLEVSPRSVALRLKVSLSTFSRLIKGQSTISPGMALRQSKCLGRSPESWLIMQDKYDLWQAKQNIDLSGIEPLAIPA